jgi:hypothetical protein
MASRYSRKGGLAAGGVRLILFGSINHVSEVAPVLLGQVLVAQGGRLEHQHAPPADRLLAGRAGHPIAPIDPDDRRLAFLVSAQPDIVLFVVFLQQPVVALLVLRTVHARVVGHLALNAE